MMPVNVCLPGAAASTATARRFKIRCFMTSRCPQSLLCPLEIDHAGAARRMTLLNLGRFVMPPSGFRAEPGRRSPAICSDGRRLFAWSHEVGGRRTRIHDPHGALLIVVG